MRTFVPLAGTAAGVAIMKVSRQCPSRRFRAPQNKQNVSFKGSVKKRILFFVVRSRNVYENKQNKDNMSDEMSDIYVRTTRILQEIPGLGGQIGRNDTLTTYFFPNLEAVGAVAGARQNYHGPFAPPDGLTVQLECAA
jgi:hypothetical protein